MFQTILFDIDGVMLSEERYFDASALTIYELLSSPQYVGLSISQCPVFRPDIHEEEIRSLRQIVFANDSVLRTMKQCGVNANWDMVYLQTAFQITEILKQLVKQNVDISPVFSDSREGWSATALRKIGEIIRTSGKKISIEFDAYTTAFASTKEKQTLFHDVNERLQQVCGFDVVPFSYERVLWNLGQNCFQEWYLGDTYNPNTRQSGKRGFLTDEVPIVEPARLQALFANLKEKGITIGVGTGRPSIETRVPLGILGWLQYFDDARVSTASEVLAAEQEIPDAAPLSKPHPFAYVRSFLKEQNAKKVLDFSLPLVDSQANETLIVGDSIADLLAARAIGCKFAAVLTGLEGEAARGQFEQMGADLILPTVLDLESYI